MLLSLIYSMFIHLYHHLFHVVKCDSVGALQNKVQLIPHLDRSLYVVATCNEIYAKASSILQLQ